MKNRLLVYFLFANLLCSAQEYEYNYTFFTNSRMSGDYFFSRTNSDGNAAVLNIKGKLPVNEDIYHTPGNSLVLHYKNAPGGKWSATIYRKEERGMDHFKKATLLSFWIYRTFLNSTMNELPRIQLMRPDSSLTPAFQFKKIKEGKWQRLTIPLTFIPGFNADRPNDFVGIVFSYEGGNENKGHTLYIDDIEFVESEGAEKITSTPVIASASDKYAKHVNITWQKITDKNVRLVKIYRSEDAKRYSLVDVQQPYINRYADFTGETGKKYWYAITLLNDKYEETKKSLPVAGSTKTMTDDDLLTMVQEASFGYYWEAAEQNSGLAKENIHGRHNMIATGASGFGIMALIAGTERKFITRQESVDRFIKIVNFLEKADRFHGVYPHFIDGPTGKVEPFFGQRDNGADLVETSFLLQGLLAARQYFSGNDPREKMIREK